MIKKLLFVILVSGCLVNSTKAQLVQHRNVLTKEELQHLLRRTLFGATFADIQHFQGKSLNQVVDELLDVPSTFTEQPVWHLKTGNPWPDLLKVGEPWIGTPADKMWSQSIMQNNVELWHYGLILEQKPNIREKMVLFYENFLPSNRGRNQFADGLYYYNRVKLNHEYAVGNYKELIKKVTFEPLMMFYLDLNGSFAYNWSNLRFPNIPRVALPVNENYARELQELYTIGKGRNNNEKLFTEDDVKAVGEVLSGWYVCNNPDGGVVQTLCGNSLSYGTNYIPALHADRDKQFSSFYGNKLIRYVAGQNGGKQEADELFDMIFARPEVAENLARKLYRFFVYSYIDDCAERDVIRPLAQIIRDNNYELKPALKALLSSSHFFSKDAQGVMIKNPFDLFAGLLRMMGTKTPSLTSLDNAGNLRAYYLYNQLKSYTGVSSMGLSAAPSVAGYPAYSEAPDYHHHWINGESMRKRKEGVFFITPQDWFVGILTASEELDDFVPKENPLTIACANQFSGVGNARAFIQDNIDYFLPQDLSQAEKDKLFDILENSKGSGNVTISWANAWSMYKNGTNYLHAYFKLLWFYEALFSYSEFQLM